MSSNTASFQGRKIAVGIGSHNIIDRQKAMDGEDPQKLWMNEGEFENLGSQSRDSKGWPTPPFGPGGCGRMGQILPLAHIINLP